MKQILTVTLLLFLLVPFTNAFGESNKDLEFRRAIIGTWVMHKKDDIAEMYGETDYKENGTFISNGYLVFNGQKSIIEFSGNWSLENGILTEDVIQSNTPEISGPSQSQVVSVTDSKYTFVSLKSGALDHMTRKQ